MSEQCFHPDEKALVPLQLESALGQDAAPQGTRTRFLWAGLGFVVITLIGSSACALHPLASHAFVVPSHPGPGLAYRPVRALGPGGMQSGTHPASRPGAAFVNRRSSRFADTRPAVRAGSRSAIAGLHAGPPKTEISTAPQVQSFPDVRAVTPKVPSPSRPGTVRLINTKPIKTKEGKLPKLSEMVYKQIPRQAPDDASTDDAQNTDASFDPWAPLAVVGSLGVMMSGVMTFFRPQPGSGSEPTEGERPIATRDSAPFLESTPTASAKKPPRAGLVYMQTPSHESKRASLDEAPDDGLNSFADDFAKVWLEAIDGPDPTDLIEDWMWPKATQLPREDWPVGLKSYRFIKKDDPTLEESSSTSSSKASEQYVPGSPKYSSTGLSKTPEQYEGTHKHGTYKGSYRVTFSSPRQSLVGLEAQANYARARQAPTTIEFLKSNELDSPSFGAVEVQLPFDIEVTQSNCVGKLSSVPHDITDAGLDARKRLVVTNVQGANAKFSKIQRGDIIRAVSVGAHDDSDKPWWSEKPEDIPWGKSVQTEAPAVEDGMVMLDGKGVSTYDAVLLENMRRHLKQEHMMPKTVQFLIERPHQVPDENDPDFFGGLRWPAFWQKSEEATPQTIPTAADLDPREEPVKHIFFDFDKTISRVHVFLVLAGWEESSAPPYALTERGQISKMRQLNSAGPYWSYNEKFGGIVPTNCNGERWTQAALGGGARIKVLRKLFADLRDQGVVMTIITKGYVGAVRTLLTEEGLIDNFDMVIGNIANSYGTNEYDLLQEERSKLEGSADDKLKVQKNEFIWTLMQREGLAPSQVVLVEDDPNEIASVGDPLICETVYVRQQQGMMAAEFDELRRLAMVPGPKEERPATKPIMPEEHFPIAKVPAPEPALAVEAAAETSAKGAVLAAELNAGNIVEKVAACVEK